jgi:hypothetical protein
MAKHRVGEGLEIMEKQKMTGNVKLSWWPGLIGGSLIAVWTLLADDVPQPGLQITLINSNQVEISITNGVGFANYELYRTPVLGEPSLPFLVRVVGTQGQTKFTNELNADPTGWFRVAVGLDWDLDGIPNWQDPQPTNPAVSNLVVTIDTPANNAILY